MIGRLFVAALAVALMTASFPAQAQSRAAAQAAQQRAELLETYGGAFEGPVAAYVRRVGERVASAAGKPGQCVFTVVNTDVVNAFATQPPGCNVYVTRGLLAILNSEDELAAVLGHEVGHVAANHAGRRQTRAALSGLGAVLVGVVSGSSDLASLASRAAQVGVLSYSRNQEYEADSLALKYAGPNGYSPFGLADMLNALQLQDQFEDRLRNREPAKAQAVWARTHPLTGDRIRRAGDQARQLTPGGAPAEREGAYLAEIDGLLFGDDPTQGFVDGNAFYHPRLGIAFDAPAGFALTNSPRAVRIEGPGGLGGEFAAGRLDGDLERYAYGVLRKLVGQAPLRVREPERTRINGVEAVIMPAMAQSSSGPVEVTVAAYAPNRGDAYHFVTLTPPGRGAPFNQLFNSFRRLSDREAAGLKPRRLDIATVKPGDTAASLADRMAYRDLKLERFRMLNGLTPDQPVNPGARVKLVIQ